MTTQGNADKDQVYHSRLETLVMVIGSQAALLEKISPNFNGAEHITRVGNLSAIAHKDKGKILDLEKYCENLKSGIDFILANSPQLVSDPGIAAGYEALKNSELMYKEFKL